MLLSRLDIYCLAFSSSAEMNSMDAEFMQYRLRVGGGPSSKTCPMCALHLAQRTSVRIRSGCLISNKRLQPFCRSYDANISHAYLCFRVEKNVIEENGQ